MEEDYDSKVLMSTSFHQAYFLQLECSGRAALPDSLSVGYIIVIVEIS